MDVHYKNFLSHAWSDYISNTPSAKKINDLLSQEGEVIINDHIAFRTWSDSPFSIVHFKKIFLDWGLVEGGEYFFPNKKVRAIHLQHPTDITVPKVFISEILWQEFSPELKKLTARVIEHLPSGHDVISMLEKKICWDLKIDDYESLSRESEYGAWLYAWGIRPNHFTVSINSLAKYQDIYALNSFLKGHGFSLNKSGGEVKGSAQIFLEQSSIMADMMTVDFSGTAKKIPSCYYEFAKRYPQNNGILYQGFNEKSADKIFESTNAKS